MDWRVVDARATEYLLVLAENRLASSTGKIARRMGVSASSLPATRKMFVSRQLIEPTAWTTVRCA